MSRIGLALALCIIAVWTLRLSPVAVRAGAGDALNVTFFGIEESGAVRAVAVSGNIAYCGMGTVFLVVDITNPSQPTKLSSLLLPSANMLDLTVVGHRAYAAHTGDGLRIIDISDPYDPVELGTYPATGVVRSVDVSGNYAYIGDSSAGIVVVDVSDPVNPTFVGSVSPLGLRQAIDVEGNNAYVASGFGGLRVLDVSNPASPVLLSTLDQDSLGIAAFSPHNPVLFDNGLLFVSWYQAGVQIIDISDPIDPVYLGELPRTPGSQATIWRG